MPYSADQTEPTVADVWRLQDEAEAKEAGRARDEAAMREAARREADEPESPLWPALMTAVGLACAVTGWFGFVALHHFERWTVAEVTAPLWVFMLAGAAVGFGIAA